MRLFQPLQAPDGTSTPVGSADSSADGLESLTPPAEVSKVGFVGLGAMGQGMARSIVTRGFSVQGYDTYPPSTEKFASFQTDNKSIGKATAAASPAEAAKEAEVFVIVVQNAAQVSDVLFGAGRAADALPYGATIILSSTVPPSFSRDLEHRLDALGRGLKLVDAPVSGGVARAANGDLTVSFSLHTTSGRQDTHDVPLDYLLRFAFSSSRCPQLPSSHVRQGVQHLSGERRRRRGFIREARESAPCWRSYRREC